SSAPSRPGSPVSTRSSATCSSSVASFTESPPSRYEFLGLNPRRASATERAATEGKTMRLNVAIPEAHVEAPVLNAALEATTRLDESMLAQKQIPTFDRALKMGIKW